MSQEETWVSPARQNAVAPRTDGVTHVDGAELAWTREGEGPLVVWVHGMTNDRWALENAGLYDWSPVVRAGFSLLRYDVRGHGRSSGGLDADQYRWDSLAGDLLALLDVLSPDAPVVAIGSSSGTATTVLAALRRPDRFGKLVLSAPPTIWESRAGQADAYHRAAEAARTDGAAAFERLTRSVAKQGLFRDLPDYPPRLRVRGDRLPFVLEGGARNDLPPRESLRALDIPALVLSWADDPVHPISSGEALTAALPDASLQVARSATELRTWGGVVAEFLGSAQQDRR